MYFLSRLLQISVPPLFYPLSAGLFSFSALARSYRRRVVSPPCGTDRSLNSETAVLLHDNMNATHERMRMIFNRELVLFCLQRGSDELLSQSGAVSNGAAMSPQPHHAADNNNDAKKVSYYLN